MHPGIAEAFRELACHRHTVLCSGDEPVVLTLETYLDLGCDVKVTAERLHLATAPAARPST